MVFVRHGKTPAERRDDLKAWVRETIGLFRG